MRKVTLSPLGRLRTAVSVYPFRRDQVVESENCTPAPSPKVRSTEWGSLPDQTRHDELSRFKRRVPVVDTKCTGTEGDDLQQATCHHDVLEEINHLVLVRKVAMEGHCSDEREQRKHSSPRASLESGNEQKPAAQLDRDGNGKSQGREGQP